MRFRLLLIAALVLTGQALIATPASATSVPRYATPAGSAAQDCLTPATACNIEKAVNQAGDGDEVILAAGTYITSTTLNPGSLDTLVLHGPATGPRPVIKSSAQPAVLTNGSQAVVHDVEIQHTGGGNLGFQVFAADVEISRVVVRSNALIACEAGTSGVFRDSLCVTNATNGTAMRLAYTGGSQTHQMTNTTLIATGPGSVGLSMNAGNATTVGLEAANVIAHAATDIKVTETGSGSAQLYLTHSNYDTLSNTTGTVTLDGTTNQSAQPVFAETTYYHQALGSPTIGAGLNNPGVGTTDIDGDARIIGTIDIGADEYVPDTDPPQTTLTKHPAKVTSKTRARFGFVADEPGASFICKLDKRKARACQAPKRYKKLKPGKHRFRVWAVDAAGNKEIRPAKWVWRIKA